MKLKSLEKFKKENEKNLIKDGSSVYAAAGGPTESTTYGCTDGGSDCTYVTTYDGSISHLSTKIRIVEAAGC